MVATEPATSAKQLPAASGERRGDMVAARRGRAAISLDRQRKQGNATPKGRLTVEFKALQRLKEAEAKAEHLAPPRPSADKYRWARGGYSQLERSLAVWSFTLQAVYRNYMIGRDWSYVGGVTEEKRSERRRALGAWAREQMLELGPTFIKLGQLFSSRSDLLPKELVAELSLLQDKVPSFSFEGVRKIIEEELDEPLHVLFERIDETPLAAASLGQVHRARLHTGEEVVVKVQRPGLEELFALDLNALRLVANYLQRSEKYGGPTRDWVGIYEECAKILMQETRYLDEADNAERFAANFISRRWIRVPKVYRDYSTTRVLCLQYIPGIKISNREGLIRAGFDPKVVAQRSSEAYLVQILEHGFFHADPHPGNVAVGPGNMLYYYDFGMMGELRPNIRDALLDLLVAIVEKDASKVVDIMIGLGALANVSDRAPIRRAVQFFLDNLSSKPMKSQTVSAIGDDLYEIARDKPFRIPATFAFVLRAFSTLEGVNRTLDPNFKFGEIAQPYGQAVFDARKRVLSGFAPNSQGQSVLGRLRQQTLTAIPAALNAPSRISRIDKTLEKLELGDIKLNAKSAETERLLRIQTSLVQNNNILYLSGVLGVITTQVYSATAGDLHLSAIPASISALLAMVWARRAQRISRDPFKKYRDDNSTLQ